jgi:hypothetical protein
VSWDAELRAADGSVEGDWNYTHNTNRMVAAALEAALNIEQTEYGDWFSKLVRSSWLDALDGQPHDKGVLILRAIVAELRANSHKYALMNPENGWGSHHGVTAILQEMADYEPDQWSTGWRWSIR